MVDKIEKRQRQGIHCYVGEIALDNVSTTEQIPSSTKSWTPQGGSRQRRACALSGHGCHHARDQLPNACADFCRPVLRPDGGEASNRRAVEHKEPAEIEPPLSKIITSQGRTRKGMRVRRCGDRSMPALARRRSRLRGILANSGRHRAGTGPSIKRSRRPPKSLRFFRHASSRSTTPIRSAPLRRAPSPPRSSSCGRLASVSARDCEPPGQRRRV